MKRRSKMAFMVLRGTFTRPNTDVPFLDLTTDDHDFLQGVTDKGLLEYRDRKYSDDGLIEYRTSVTFIETIADMAVVASNLRIDPGWYEMHIALQEHCDTHNIARGPIILECYNADWALLNSSQFLVSDLF